MRTTWPWRGRRAGSQTEGASGEAGVSARVGCTSQPSGPVAGDGLAASSPSVRPTCLAAPRVRVSPRPQGRGGARDPWPPAAGLNSGQEGPAVAAALARPALSCALGAGLADDAPPLPPSAQDQVRQHVKLVTFKGTLRGHPRTTSHSVWAVLAEVLSSLLPRLHSHPEGRRTPSPETGCGPCPVHLLLQEAFQDLPPSPLAPA